eukprot:654021-Pyramimonas_sp.AAC.1
MIGSATPEPADEPADDCRVGLGSVGTVGTKRTLSQRSPPAFMRNSGDPAALFAAAANSNGLANRSLAACFSAAAISTARIENAQQTLAICQKPDEQGLPGGESVQAHLVDGALA